MQHLLFYTSMLSEKKVSFPGSRKVILNKSQMISNPRTPSVRHVNFHARNCLLFQGNVGSKATCTSVPRKSSENKSLSWNYSVLWISTDNYIHKHYHWRVHLSWNSFFTSPRNSHCLQPGCFGYNLSRSTMLSGLGHVGILCPTEYLSWVKNPGASNNGDTDTII